jgi:hypothetical protein
VGFVKKWGECGGDDGEGIEWEDLGGGELARARSESLELHVPDGMR